MGLLVDDPRVANDGRKSRRTVTMRSVFDRKFSKNALASRGGATDLALSLVNSLSLISLGGIWVTWFLILCFGSSSLALGKGLWRTFGLILIIFWVTAVIRVVAHLIRRVAQGNWLIVRRSELLNLGSGPDQKYLANREFVYAPSPFKALTKRAVWASGLSIGFICLVNSQPLDGWVRASIVVTILSLLAVPIGLLASLIDHKVALSDYKLAADL